LDLFLVVAPVIAGVERPLFLWGSPVHGFQTRKTAARTNQADYPLSAALEPLFTPPVPSDAATYCPPTVQFRDGAVGTVTVTVHCFFLLPSQGKGK
jgi:hypothetical protein